MFPLADGRTEAFFVIIDAVALEFFVAKPERAVTGRPQINRGILFISNDLVEYTAHLEAR